MTDEELKCEIIKISAEGKYKLDGDWYCEYGPCEIQHGMNAIEDTEMTDTEGAQTIWEAFCGELTQEPTDDMKEALVTAIKELVSQLQYDNCDWQAPDDWKIMDVEQVMLVVNQLEAL